MVWMRISALPNFKKLYGKIDRDLPKGTYKLTIDNKFSVDSFNGSRKFFL